jgi:hypothetical protein
VRLLSVDWDYFFVDLIGTPPIFLPVLSEEGQIDLRQSLVKTRVRCAREYLKLGRGLPGTSGEERTFWTRFCFSPDSLLFTAEDHVRAADPEVMDRVCEVWNFDAHHDSGYENPPNRGHNDGNWLMAYGGQVRKFVRYPQWKTAVFEHEPSTLIEVDRRFDDGRQIEFAFDRVFICRSGQWVPPWLDEDYKQFVKSCPAKQHRSWPLVPRDGVSERVKAALS